MCFYPHKDEGNTLSLYQYDSYDEITDSDFNFLKFFILFLSTYNIALCDNCRRNDNFDITII